MRRRLLAGGMAVVAVALVLFALPLAMLLRSQLVTASLDGFAATIEQTATLVDEQSRTCGEVQRLLTALAREDVQVTVFDRGGTVRFAQADVLTGGDLPEAGAVVEQAAQGATGSQLRDGELVVAVPLSTVVCDERLVLQGVADGAALAQRVQRAWLLLALAVAGAVVAGGLVAWRLGRGLAGPLESLARSARRLGEGDFTARAPRSGLPEPDAIADALDQTADRLGRAVARGTAFAADASHQLRTPLTALRLRLETAMTDDLPDEMRERALDGAITEVDRLAATIDELVALTHPDESPELVDVTSVVEERAPAWAGRAATLGRRIVVDAAPVPPRAVRPQAIGQALEVLVDNALRHGAGDVRIEVRPSTPDAEEAAVRIVVRDAGGGLPPDALVLADRRDRGGLPVTGGRGLPLARDLVEGEGGRLVLASDEHGTAATIHLRVVEP